MFGIVKKYHKCGVDCSGVACSRGGDTINQTNAPQDPTDRLASALHQDLINRIPSELRRISEELSEWADDRFVLEEAAREIEFYRGVIASQNPRPITVKTLCYMPPAGLPPMKPRGKNMI